MDLEEQRIASRLREIVVHAAAIAKLRHEASGANHDGLHIDPEQSLGASLRFRCLACSFTTTITDKEATAQPTERTP